MKGIRGLWLALITALLIPAALSAQQKPKDSKYTRDAAKFIGLAMMRQDDAEREKMYQDALNALNEGFERDADNPKFWLVAGQTYAGLGQLDKANEAFEKAIELYPEYEAEVEGEREAAWMEGFSRGIDLMDEQKDREAVAVFEAANQMYPHRPEGYLNIGALYANMGEIEKAIASFEKAITAVGGPIFEKLDAEGQQQWAGYREMASVNIAQMRGSQGVEAFQRDDYKQAEVLFRQAAEVNPHSRDYLYNIVQSRYAQTTELEKKIEEDPAAAAQVGPELTGLYTGLKGDIKKVQAYDPNNEDLYMILARAEKRLGELAGDTVAAQQGALAVLQQLNDMPVEIGQLSIQPSDGTAQISGELKNRNLSAGTPVTIKLTLLDRKGEAIGEQQVVVNAPEKEQSATFNVTAEAKGQIAGWKYQVVS